LYKIAASNWLLASGIRLIESKPLIFLLKIFSFKSSYFLPSLAAPEVSGLIASGFP
jgi:hypothetical protein